MSDSEIKKPKLLLHICCVGCGAFVAGVLKENYELSLYFYNPGIYPEREYKKRLGEARRVAEEFGLELIIGDYDHKSWLIKTHGHENDPERGERCLICYRDRLETTARVAQARGCGFFSSTLTVSPHKLARAIFKIGHEAADKYGVNFHEQDFKKQDGFKKASLLSKKLGLYRQDYCGCEFSMRRQTTDNRRQKKE